jgi:hypothetical protein
MADHSGVDKDSGLIHLVVTTAANVHNLTQGPSFCIAMRRSSTAMPATRASPRGLEWRAIQQNSGWRCDQASDGFYRTRLKEASKT